MGGDRRSPPHPRAKGGGGVKTRNANGGKILGSVGGVVLRSNDDSRSRVKDNLGNKIQSSELNKSLKDIASGGSTDLEIETAVCPENRDSIEQDFNNSGRIDNENQDSVASICKSEDGIQICKQNNSIAVAKGNSGKGVPSKPDATVIPNSDKVQRDSEDKLSGYRENRDLLHQDVLEMDRDRKEDESKGIFNNSDAEFNSSLGKIQEKEYGVFYSPEEIQIQTGIIINPNSGMSVLNKDRNDQIEIAGSNHQIEDNSGDYDSITKNDFIIPDVIRPTSDLEASALEESSVCFQDEGRDLGLKKNGMNDGIHSNIQHTKELPSDMRYNVLNPIFRNDNANTQFDGDCDMLLNVEEDLCNNHNSGNIFMNERISCVELGKDLSFIDPKTSVKDYCMEGVCCNDSLAQLDVRAGLEGGFGPGDADCLNSNAAKNDSAFCKKDKQVPNAWKKPAHVLVDWGNKGRATDDGKFVKLNMEAVDCNHAKLQKALVGRLIGRKLPFSILERELRKRWEAFGEFHFLMIGDDGFTCIFKSVEARDAVLMGGPWLIGGYIVGLDRWSPSFSHGSMSGLTAPVWIRFPKLPLLYWDNDNLARIASMVGQPLWIDALTSQFGRCAYARVCVRLDLAHKLPTGVWIPGINGNFFQNVVYEGIHKVCFKCGHIGHLKENCDLSKEVPSRMNESVNKRKEVFGWKHDNLGGMDFVNFRKMGAVSVPPLAKSTSPLVMGECSLDGAVVHGAEQISNIADDVEDLGHGPWIFVSRKKGRDRGGAKSGPGNVQEHWKKKSLVSNGDGHKDQLQGKGFMVLDSESPLASTHVHPGASRFHSERKLDRFASGNMVLEQPGKVETVTSKGELVPSTALFNSKGKDVLGKNFNFCNEKDEVNKIVVFSASRDENSVFTGDGKANVSSSKERGSSRVPSSKEISRLGPIAYGSRKRRKGNVIDDDCSGFHDTCDGAAKESGFLGSVGIPDGGGDASPLMS